MCAKYQYFALSSVIRFIYWITEFFFINFSSYTDYNQYFALFDWVEIYYLDM